MRLTLATILLILAFGLKAQDAHFTQKWNNQLFVNPALTGNGEKVNRLSFLYRDQWRVVPVKYVSTFFNYDRKVFENEEHLFAAGVQFFYDKAGDGALSTFNPNISVSYTRFFNGKKQGISLGLDVGYLQRTVDQSKLYFDSQYTGGQFDPSQSSGEQFGSSARGANLGLGLNFMTKMGELSKWDFGVAIFNPHRPDFNFYNGSVGTNASKEGRPIRYTAYVTSELFVNTHWSITPSFHFQQQEKAQEYHASAFMSYYTRNEKIPVKYSLGGGYRVDDAALVYTGLKVKDIQLGLSYDINTSDFQDATNKRGGFEVSLIYEWEKKKAVEIDSIEEIIDTIFITEIDSNEIIKEEEELVEVEVEEEPEIVETPKDIVPAEFELIQKDLPIKLFFDNDHPNPNSTATTTNLSYAQTLHQYQLKQYEFGKQIGKQKADDWFRTVYDSNTELDTLVQYATVLLEQGYSIEITIKGFASPLAESDYNANLSMRRISSAILELKKRNFGSLVPYFRDGSISIVQNPYGESYAPALVDDNYNNPKKSVYSVEASYERRVEIITIKAVKE